MKYGATIWSCNATPGHISGQSIILKDAYTSMFIATLFTIGKTGKYPKCPSIEEWIKKMWYIYTITMDGDCSHEIKRCLVLGRKAMANLDSILKSKDITLPRKVHLVKAMVFPVVMYGCESWTIKETEHQRIDAFELWCWRRLLRVP